MKIFSAEQIRSLDQATIEGEPIASIDLMERASRTFTNWFIARYKADREVLICCGMGNNGGDGLAVARMLSESGYSTAVFVLDLGFPPSDDFSLNLERLRECDIPLLISAKPADLPGTSSNPVIVDALFGSGLNRPVEGSAAELLGRLNAMQATRVSIDIPSGMPADGLVDGTALKADHCLAFEFPKRAFLAAENESWLRNWSYRSIGLLPAAIKDCESKDHFTTFEEVRGIFRHRATFSHKGSNGHSLILAGSYGKMGAALLAASACLRVGSGLLSLGIPADGRHSAHAAVPETMLLTDPNPHFLSVLPVLTPYQSIGIGPGIGTEPEVKQLVLDLLQQGKALVIDADALNLIAAEGGPDKLRIPAGSILTPHPKEFDRLAGPFANSIERCDKASDMARKHGLVIVLKGAWTMVAFPDGSRHFNSSGNPALGTAGSGDVLTGIITGFLSQGYSPEDAALIGVWLHGHAADLYQQRIPSGRMIASDIIEELPAAIADLHG